MVSILITLTLFVFAFMLQVLLVRIFRRLYIHPFASFVILFIGFFVVLELVLPAKELSYTSILVYILLTILLITFTFVPQLGVRSPSSIIITKLQMKQASLLEIQNEFVEKQLILLRLHDLVDVGLVQKHGAKYIISPLGKFLTVIISGFSVLMGLKI